MGQALSRDQAAFVESFATSTNFSEADLVSGLGKLAPALSATNSITDFSPDVAAVATRVADGLYLNAVEQNRIGLALDYAARQLTALTAESSQGIVGQTANAVRFAQILVATTIARCNGSADVLVKLCNTNEELTRLHTAAVVFVAQNSQARTRLNGDMRLHADVLLLLLSLYSTTLYHRAIPGSAAEVEASSAHTSSGEPHDVHADSLIDAVVYFDDAALVKMLISNLLMTYTSWCEGRVSSMVQYKAGFQPSLLNLYNLLGYARRDQRTDVATVLASRALHVFAVLVTYKKPLHVAAGRSNVVAGLIPEAAVAAVGAGLDAVTQPVLGVPSPSPSILELLNGLSKRLHELPESMVVLYSLLCSRKSDVMQVLAPDTDKTDSAEALILLQSLSDVVGPLMENLAHVAYDCIGSGGIAPLSFLVGTVLLQLSTDSRFVTQLFDVKVTAPWYKERFVGVISAGSLLLTVVSRAAARAAAISNHDIAELNLGVMANMAPYVHDMDTICAQRLATMLKHMVKRLATAKEAVTRDSTDYAASAVYKSVEGHCCLALDTLLGMLDGSSRNNLALLYDLLHQKPEIFSVTAQYPPGSVVADAVAPLSKLISYYESEVMSTAASTSGNVDEVMKTMRRVSAEVSAPDIIVGTGMKRAAQDGEEGEGLSACERNVFEYVEDEDAYEYFAPLLWRAVLARSGGAMLLPLETASTASEKMHLLAAPPSDV